jgi:hypothetical protein
VRKPLEQKMDIEKQLEAALRAQDPGPAFTRAVLARVHARTNPVRATKRWHLPASLAASVVLALLGVLFVQRDIQQQRLAYNHEQLVLALAITSAELNHVQQKLSPGQSQENGI